jgi:hypothetical protein
MNPIHLSPLHLTIPLLMFQLPSKVVYTKKKKMDFRKGKWNIPDFWANTLAGLSLPEFTHMILP